MSINKENYKCDIMRVAVYSNKSLSVVEKQPQPTGTKQTPSEYALKVSAIKVSMCFPAIFRHHCDLKIIESKNTYHLSKWKMFCECCRHCFIKISCFQLVFCVLLLHGMSVRPVPSWLCGGSMHWQAVSRLPQCCVSGEPLWGLWLRVVQWSDGEYSAVSR